MTEHKYDLHSESFHGLRNKTIGKPVRMSKNDAIILKANFNDWIKRRAQGLQGVDPWLYFCVEQFVKPYMLDDDELKLGITDGGNDGGIDATYFIANHSHIITEDTKETPNGISRLRLIFIQVKKSGGFKPTEIEKLIETSDDFFDLSESWDSFGDRYNDDVMRAMRTWKNKIIKLTSRSPELFIDYFYITGDDAVPDDYAISSGERVKAKARLQNSKANCEYHFVGAAELWDQVQRRPPKSIPLAWSETPMSAVEGTVGLVNLKEYYKFLQEEDGSIAERFFESNVRGYQKDVVVNKQIHKSLKDDKSGTNFWLLNNGITIISPDARTASHKLISIEDPQIVNGLQTSREIFNYFNEFPDREDTRSVLVRVIQTSDANVHDQIIRATNSQNRMSASQLRMTDQIHRDIEEMFKEVGLFYDRRKGFYRDQGEPISKIVSVDATAQAVISILLQKPNDARARPGDYFKNEEKYKSIFGEGRFPLYVYKVCTKLVADVENYLYLKDVSRSDIKNLKFYIAALVIQELTGVRTPVAEKIANLDSESSVDSEIMDRIYQLVSREYSRLSKRRDRDTVARGTELVKLLDIGPKETSGKNRSRKAIAT